jgi:hypothetical protein
MITGKELDKRLEEAGMISVSDRIKGGPLDKFMATAEVKDIETLYQWVYNQRKSYMEMMARNDLGLYPLGDDVFDFILGKSAMLGEFHINMRNVLHELSQPLPSVVFVGNTLVDSDQT